MSTNTHHEPSPELVEQVNTAVRYAAYSVFRSTLALPPDRGGLADQVRELFTELQEEGLVIRGLYDVAGFRADADLLIWWHSDDVELIQKAYQKFRQTRLGHHLEPVWSNIGLHRPSEFNRGHIPAFLAGTEPKKFICVYPFVRSYDWYVLDPAERSRMLREHGQAAHAYKDVQANTISAFALGDYEWLLAFEADEVHRITDLMRELRAVDARLHVREEIPFFTGPMLTLDELVERLP
ncbi:MAG: chlorite dismutase family protein [Ornithinimicrobium sp.]|uniref:hydrogen peroxide-dependent heme synthase n=1 Tax=Ornithinimicrobium sp. TaxID=1977084 RepID=UPI0026DFF44B|nr:hydrogen peroxide-dependent heme synthase [Ornithinimicrobium sp.]MDO5740093.1 chlorite dismutase family protein [Ornithinimicrobium sp.]